MLRARSVSGRTALGAVAIWLASSAAFFTLGPYAALRTAAGGSLPEEQFGYGVADVRRAFEALGEAHLPGYVTFQGLDALNAAVTSASAAAVLLWSLSRRPGTRGLARRAVWLPVALLAGECVENSLLVFLASSHPATMPSVVRIASATTRFKLVTGMIVTVAVAVSSLVGSLRQARPGSEFVR